MTAPFEIFLGASVLIAVIVGGVMWEIAASEDDKSRGFWITIFSFGKKMVKKSPEQHRTGQV
jgi:hypothetical protein